MRYAGFWRRLGALLIDVLVMLPLAPIPFAVRGLPAVAALPLLVTVGAAWPTYLIFCHGRFGQTLGKRITGIRVHLVTGQRISWKVAFLRHSPDLVLAVLWTSKIAYELTARAPGDWEHMTFLEWGRALKVGPPAYFQIVDSARTFWDYSEPLVLLLNKRRRAIHDFIAGTVVLVVNKTPAN